jgi:hypothetical protein
MEYRRSTLHYFLMTPELGMLFSLLCAKDSAIYDVRWWVFGISLVLFALGFICFISWQRTELRNLGFQAHKEEKPVLVTS